jgi:multiple antibiotic resistance protein
MDHYVLSSTQVFSLLFVMLGPFEKLIPFARASHALSQEEIKNLSFKSIGLSTASLIVGGYLGCSLLKEWSIQIPVLAFTTGLIFLIKALSLIFPVKKEESIPLEHSKIEASNIAYSIVMNPYGMAVVVGLLAMSKDFTRTLTVLGILLFILFLDLIAMIFIRKLTGKVGVTILQFVGTVFIVLQAALGMNIVITAIRFIMK